MNPAAGMTDVEVCWYEDDECRGFLPIEPRSELLSRHVFDTGVAGIWHYLPVRGRPQLCSGESLALVAEPDNAGMIQRALAPDGINLVHASGAAAWQTIIHFHVHVIPRYEGDSLVPPWPLDQPEADHSALQALAERIRSAGELGSAPSEVSADLGDRTD